MLEHLIVERQVCNELLEPPVLVLKVLEPLGLFGLHAALLIPLAVQRCLAHFEHWTEVLGSERLTGATLDRLTHRCHILEAGGESYRLKDAKGRRKRSSGATGNSK